MWEMLWYSEPDEPYIEAIPQLVDIRLKPSRWMTEQTRYCGYLTRLSEHQVMQLIIYVITMAKRAD